MDTNILRQRSYPEKVAAPDDTPHACYDGWVYLGFEVAELDENGELLEEVIERVPCRRCAPERAEAL